MVRNPSELARLEDDLEYFRSQVKDLSKSKGYRELALRQVRHLENQLGLDSKPYNG